MPAQRRLVWTLSTRLRPPDAFTLRCAVASLSLARKAHPEARLVIHTDHEGRRLLGPLGLPCDEMHATLEGALEGIPHAFWAAAKLVTYRAEAERPFIHLDADVFLFRPLPDWCWHAPVLVQNFEARSFYRYALDGAAWHKVDLTGIVLPPERWAAWNMGVAGFNCGPDAVRRYVDGGLAHARGLLAALDDAANILFEQAWLARFCVEAGIGVKPLLKGGFDDRAAKKLGYCHLMRAKTDPDARRRVAKLAASLAPEADAKIAVLADALDRDHVPKLADQPGIVEVARIHPPVEWGGGSARNFNPSVLDGIIFWRRNDADLKTRRAEIWGGFVRHGDVVNARRVVACVLPVHPGMIPDHHAEDPRAFVHDLRLHLSWVDARHGVGEWTCRQRLAELNPDFTVNDIPLPEVENDRPGADRLREKNWLFFTAADGDLCFIYSLDPLVIVDLAGRVRARGPGLGAVRRGAAFPWHPRGSCCAWKDGVLRVWFQGSAWTGRVRRYRVGCLDLNPATGEIVRWAGPVLTGSLNDHALRWTDLDLNTACFYPGSCEFRNGEWILTGGINDTNMAVVRYREAALCWTDDGSETVTGVKSPAKCSS